LSGFVVTSQLVHAAPSAQELAAAVESERRGLEMYAYDQAAWHGTDRFQADVAAAGGSDFLRQRGYRGYIVEPVSGGLQAVFYRERDGRLTAIARYSVSGSKVTGGGIVALGAEEKMTPLALRMVDALAKAREAMAKPDHGLCSNTPPNSVVLSQPDGTLSAYILTSTHDANIYPAGGHYRFDFNAAGTLVAERKFMNSCFPINFKDVPRGKEPALLVLSHLLDPQPTEIHAFVSRNIPVALAVMTVSNDLIWAVGGGRVQFLRDGMSPAKGK
jgi:hypothetical protein